MRVLLQRVSEAEVWIEKEDGQERSLSGKIGKGYLLLVGITHSDSEQEVDWMAAKVAGLRLFEDSEGKLNLSLSEVDGEILLVSQFTLYGDASKGRRPSFIDAARPETAEPLYELFQKKLEAQGFKVATGVFGAMMHVGLINHGPVTIWLER